jgi:hypothetical protein
VSFPSLFPQLVELATMLLSVEEAVLSLLVLLSPLAERLSPLSALVQLLPSLRWSWLWTLLVPQTEPPYP